MGSSGGGGGVEVWRVDLDAGPVGVRPLEEELERAQRLRDEVGRHRFLASRAWLRLVLGRPLGLDHDEMRFTYGERGKPSVVGGGDVRFSLSRSGRVGLIAVTRGREVGVDVERTRSEVSHEAIARQLFAPAESADLDRLTGAARTDAFFSLWTRKEAVVKARGAGLGDGLDGFDARADTVADRWSVRSLDVGPGYAAAVATDGPLGPISVKDGAPAGRGRR